MYQRRILQIFQRFVDRLTKRTERSVILLHHFHLYSAFVQEHSLKRFCVEASLEQVAFAEKQIVDIQAAVVHGFKITLAFCKNHICLFQKRPGFIAESREPGSAYVASVSVTFTISVSPISSASSMVASLTTGYPRTMTVIFSWGYFSFKILTASLSRTISPQLSVR